MDTSNQLRTGATPDTDATASMVKPEGLLQVTANTKGTGREGIPTAMALKSKRKENAPLSESF